MSAGPPEAMWLTEVVGLPADAGSALPPLERPACLSCGTTSRPLWDGVCAWCGADDEDLEEG